MALERINPESLGAPSGYSHGVLAPAGGRLLFVAGEIGWDKDSRIVSDDFPGQFRQALANILAVVEAAGGGPEHVARLTVYVTDRSEYLSALSEVGRQYRSVMGRNFPAMALVEVQALLHPEAKVEIEGTAVLP
jgi:enamine deaminase RidA (YjgF/YER057c/UK114 family)